MIQQGTEQWFSSRLGKVTASRVKDVIAKTKTGYSTSRKNYALELALERITGNRQEGYTNGAMQRGTDMEPIARAAYEALTGEIVEEVGLIDHPAIDMSGASPDGLVGKEGLIEIKVPNSATHLEVLTSKRADPQYMPQMQWQMACTGRRWVDFVSFDDRFPEHLRLFVHRVNRDDAFIADLEAEVASFLKEVDGLIEQINSL